MKKHLTTVAIFLLAGAVVNVAVAWGCAVFVTIKGGTVLDDRDSYVSLPMQGHHHIRWVGVGTDGLTDRIFRMLPYEEETLSLTFTGWAGLPTRCLGGRYYDHVEQGTWTTDHAQVWPLCESFGVPHPQRSLSPPWRRTGLGFLPLSPLWPGCQRALKTRH